MEYGAKRPVWAVADQVVQDNATGLRFEFDATSGTMPVLRVFTKERTRVLILMFTLDGFLIKSDVRGVRDGQLEDVGQAAFQELHQDPAVDDAAARSSADLMAHQGDRLEVVDVSQDVNEQASTDARQADEAPKKQGVFYGDE